MPEVVNIEATGLGGKDLRVVGPWDISIRTDPEGQNVYGPSLATVEDVVIEPCQSGGTSTKHVTSLGMSKATHEFLTLNYFALDSAEWWERILGELLPNAHFPDAVIRRNFAYKMFMAAHIAPSHRRPPHPVWEDSLCLIADLLFGNGMDRYVGAMQGPDSPLEVNVRGFSAGSHSGLAFLHILWSIPRVTTKGFLGAIACPPSLLNMSRAKKEDLSVTGLLLCSGTFVHDSISEDRGLDSSPASPHSNPVEDIERAIASEWTRVEEKIVTLIGLLTTVSRHVGRPHAKLAALPAVQF